MVKDYHWLPWAPRASVAIGSCPKCCKPHLSKTAYIQWARQCYAHPLHQEHLQRSRELKRPKWNCNAIMRKTIENHWKPRKSMPCPVRGRFCSRCKLCSNWGTLSSTCSSMSLSKLLSWSKLTMLVEWGLLGVQWHIVMLLYAKDLHETYWCHWKSSKFEHLSDIHKERVLKCALEVSKHLDYHWWHWCGMIYSS